MPPASYVKPLSALFTASVGYAAWRVLHSAGTEAGDVEERPFVIPAPSTGAVEIALTGRDLSMQLWNVGTEPATVDSMSLRDEQGDLLAWGLTRSPVKPGAVQDLDWQLPGRVPGDGESCMLRISYRDRAGIRYETASKLRAGRPACVCTKFSRSIARAA